MEQDEGFGLGIRGVTEVVDVTIVTQAADEGGAGRSVHGLPVGTDGNLAIVADAHGCLLAPDEAPPRTGGRWPQRGALFGEGLGACGVGG